nr:ribonuclease H-like domain, reverse transcriptase, RNA-dependent DNA polymerase [Tanacetum cinerariifolium]
GIEVTQTNGDISIRQSTYANKILKEAGMIDFNETLIPMDPETRLTKASEGKMVNSTEYQSIIGCLRYLLHTRLDLSYSVGLLSRFMQEPRGQHMKAIRQVLRYVKGTKDHRITYKHNGGNKIHGYSDSSYGVNTQEGKGTTDVIFYYGESPISWSMQKQATIALSSYESEFIAVIAAATQVLWLKRLLSKLTHSEEDKVTISVDNKSTIALMKNLVFHRRSKHIDTKYHFIRECVEREDIQVEFVKENQEKDKIGSKPDKNGKRESKKGNDQEQIQALVDKKKVIITEDNIRSDLSFDDAEGTACLLNEVIFKGLAGMGAKTIAWHEFSSTMASAIICLDDNQTFNFSKRKQRNEAEVSHDESEDEDHVPTPSSDPLPSGRMIEEIDQDDEIALDADTQGRKNDDEMFGVDDLSGEEVVLDTTNGEHKEQIIEDVSTAEPITTSGEVVTNVADKVSAAPTTDVTEDEIIIAQALAALKTTATTVTATVPTPRAKGIVYHKQKQSHIPTVSSSNDKDKAKIIEPEVPIKKKDQMRMDEDLLDERLQASEREEFFEEQKARLLVELIEKRKKHFAALRAQEKRNKTPTKAQIRSQMYTYLRNMGGYKHSYLKGKSYDEIKNLFDREMRKVNNFIAIASEAQNKMEKKHKKAVLKEQQKVLNLTFLRNKRSPTIIDYKIHKEGKKTYFKIIRADRNSQVYQTFEKMFKNFNREDLEVRRIMSITKEQQQALDDALVPREQLLRIGNCNYRLSTTFKPKEPTFQVALDATSSFHKHSIKFKLNNKRYSFDVETFRHMLQICPNLPGEKFVDPPFEEEILAFIRELGYHRNIKSLSDVKVEILPQP